MTESNLSPEVRAFLEKPRFGVLATINPDGSPQQTVMWYELQGDNIMMNTRRGRKKDRNLVNDSRASITIEEGQRFVTISGKISIDEDPVRGQRTIKELAERYEGPEAAEEQSASSYSAQHRITLELSIDRVITHGF
jgi:PPOX class probable F420-dependent enzyme